jgi:carboxypeptidase Taq
MTKSYKLLEAKFKEIGLIESVSSIMDWDASVNMPEGSTEARSESTAYLSKLSFSNLVNQEVKDLLDEAELNAETLNDWQKANLKEMRYKYRRCHLNLYITYLSSQF